jgi:membrane-bound lytic murein transglycosylase MltF
MRRAGHLRLVLAFLAVLAACDAGDAAGDALGDAVAEATAEAVAEAEAEALGLGGDHTPPVERLLAPWFGDLPGMRARRVVRVLVTYDKTNFFFRDGRAHGFEYEMLRGFERELNAGLARDEVRTHLAFVPVPFEDLLSGLLEGRGDVAAAGLTITPAREERVAFSAPYLEDVSEIFVTSRALDPEAPLEQVAGRTVVVPRRTSYVRHLEALGVRLGRPIEVVKAAAGLQTEDLLELVSAGAIEVTVSDHHVAEIWSRVYPDLVLRHDLPVHEGARIAWAVRPESRELREALSRFARAHRRGTLVGNVLFRRYYADGSGLSNPLGEAEMGRLRRLEPLFRRYAERYDFDWLAIAAQAYAESGLRHDRRSHHGAVGIMQLLPSTAADRAVGIPDISRPEDNIHAGVRYLAHLRDRFASQGIEAPARFDFALAAYNAGPGRVRRFRKRALERALDPDRWFRNVELAALELVGQETVDYVAKVNKYYVAYRLARDANRLRRDARASALESGER